jgi:hypothetical protein
MCRSKLWMAKAAQTIELSGPGLALALALPFESALWPLPEAGQSIVPANDFMDIAPYWTSANQGLL